MDFKPIAVVIGPCVTFFLGILSERLKNRKQLALDIESIDRGNFDSKKLLSFFKNFMAAEINKNELITDITSESFQKKWSAFRENLKAEENDKNEIIAEFIADIGSKLFEKKWSAFLNNLEEAEIDKNKFIADVVNELFKSSPCINGTIVNTGRIPVAVQELRINFSKNPSDDKETGLSVQFLEKLLSKKTAQWLRWKKKVLISKLLPRKIKRWYARRVELKMTETSSVLYYNFPKRGRVFTLAPGESEFFEISMKEITNARDFLDSEDSFLMVYPSCKLVGEEKIRRGPPIYCSLISSSLLGREITLPIFINLKY